MPVGLPRLQRKFAIFGIYRPRPRQCPRRRDRLPPPLRPLLPPPPSPRPLPSAPATPRRPPTRCPQSGVFLQVPPADPNALGLLSSPDLNSPRILTPEYKGVARVRTSRRQLPSEVAIEDADARHAEGTVSPSSLRVVDGEGTAFRRRAGRRTRVYTHVPRGRACSLRRRPHRSSA